MPVDMGAERSLGIVSVNHADVVEPKQAVRFRDGVAQTGCARDIEAGGQKMAGIETEADREIGHLRRVLAQDVKLLKAAAELRACARGVFKQQHELAESKALRGRGHVFEDIENSLLEGLALVIAGMRDQVIGSDGNGTFELSAEGLDGLGSHAAVDRGEIDE